MQKLVFALTLACLLAPASTRAQKAYVTNFSAVSVIDTATNTVSTTIPVGGQPFGVAVTPDGSKVYVGNNAFFGGIVQVINPATNGVSANIPVGGLLQGVAVTPDGRKVYVATYGGLAADGTVSVINTATNTLSATIPVGRFAYGVAVPPDGSKVYVGNAFDHRIGDRHGD
jgi:YVTN family beta-propeller protein